MVMAVPLIVVTTIGLATGAECLTQLLQEVLQRRCNAAARGLGTARRGSPRTTGRALRGARIDAGGLQQRCEVGLKRL